MNKAEKYLRYIIPNSFFGSERTKEILHINPVSDITREDAEKVMITVYDYNESHLFSAELKSVKDSHCYLDNSHVSWINIDGIRKGDVEEL
ncbi:MAG TPA: magnesium and cobalt transport protein CorA, partial [Flavisolibacter sp.]